MHSCSRNVSKTGGKRNGGKIELFESRALATLAIYTSFSKKKEEIVKREGIYVGTTLEWHWKDNDN